MTHIQINTDENDSENYDFTFTDVILEEIVVAD